MINIVRLQRPAAHRRAGRPARATWGWRVTVARDQATAAHVAGYLETHGAYTRRRGGAAAGITMEKLPRLMTVGWRQQRTGVEGPRTQFVVPVRQSRGDGSLASLDSLMLYRAVTAAGAKLGESRPQC